MNERKPTTPASAEVGPAQKSDPVVDGMVTPTVAVVIVNYNTGHRLKAAVESILRSDRSGYAQQRIVVVDNGSADASLEGLSDLAVHEQVHIVRNPTNLGFAVACNQGARATESDYVLFLNPDTEVASDSVARAVAFMESPEAARVGICGARLVSDGASAAAARFPSVLTYFGDATRLSTVAPRWFPAHFLSESELATTREVDQVSGAFFFVRRSLYDLLQGFDERFFVYYEEVDFSLRAARLRYSSRYLRDVVCRHEGGVSSNTVPAERLFYILRSRLLFARKNLRGIEFLLIVVITWTIELAGRTLVAGASRQKRNLLIVLRAYLWLAKSTPDLWRRSAPLAQ